jgi:serine/threonine protein kinase
MMLEMTRRVMPLSPRVPPPGHLPSAEAPFSLPFRSGEVIGGKYQVVELIGIGGIGFVVSALHLELGEGVALKFLRPEFLSHPEAVRRFANEARSAVKIKSEHVARVFDVGALPDGTPFIVMDLLEGRDLSEVLREEGSLSTELAVEYVLQTCEALATAHASGIVHRDVKPDNLFLTKRPQGLDFIKVLDFGISKLSLAGSSGSAWARTTTAIGSPHYMSPEQVRASETIDARADIWSLGCVLYELLTGKPAFNGPSLMQICAAVLETDPVPPRSIHPAIPSELEAVVLRCLEKSPGRRYPDVGELAIALVPFAPARAHVWAERSRYVLLGRERSSGEVTASIRAVVANRSSRGSLPAEYEPMSIKAVSLSADDIVSFRSAAAPKRKLLVALSLVVAGGGYALWRGSSANRPQAAQAAEPPSNGRPDIALAAQPGANSVDHQDLTAADAALIPASTAAADVAPKTPSAPSPPKTTSSPPRPRQPPPAPARPRSKPSVEGDPDVGF